MKLVGSRKIFISLTSDLTVVSRANTLLESDEQQSCPIAKFTSVISAKRTSFDFGIVPQSAGVLIFEENLRKMNI